MRVAHIMNMNIRTAIDMKTKASMLDWNDPSGLKRDGNMSNYTIGRHKVRVQKALARIGGG